MPPTSPVTDSTATRSTISPAPGAARAAVRPAGVACALARPPRSAVSTAVHALTLLSEQRLILDVAGRQHEVELIVLPPVCPLSVSSTDFRCAGVLIERARNA